jgi:hypothetical protein
VIRKSLRRVFSIFIIREFSDSSCNETLGMWS